MQQFEHLEQSQYYHIYNHGVGGRDLFADTNNYEYFLALYDTYISPIAETYAWCLMPNHFHLLVRIKDESEVVVNNELKIGTPSQQFSKLFNAYAQAYNKYHQTHGTLFERPFRRKLVNSDDYRKRVVVYIHNNPVHHGFCKHPLEYPWSSYLACTTEKLTNVKREEVMGWFGGRTGFVAAHDPSIGREEMDEWLGV
ncbi:MAG: transposase [Breznakibacter sp.]